ncbi:hypothetical protein JXC34_02520 [Candidatus Woesearchaeota archaeon]|nr:hypothetical protein [Candidatus Woesearchaeota archaeon]
MAKKKQDKPKSVGVLKLILMLFSILQSIILLPFRTIGTIMKMSKDMKKKSRQRQQEKKRGSILPQYQEFTVVEAEAGDLDRWEKKIMRDSVIGIIIGARGKGKTAIGVKILENVHAKTNKKCYALGFNEEDLPTWIHVTDNIEKITNDSFVLIDEGGVLFSSRKSMTNANQMLSELILVARHKSLSILFISQNSANLEINILRQADYLILKPSSLLQKDFERKKIKELYEDLDFKKYTEKGITYIYSEEFRGFVNNPLPSFWNLNISKSFK